MSETIQKGDWVRLQFSPERLEEIKNSRTRDLIGKNGKTGKVTDIMIGDHLPGQPRLFYIEGPEKLQCWTWERDCVMAKKGLIDPDILKASDRAKMDGQRRIGTPPLPERIVFDQGDLF